MAPRITVIGLGTGDENQLTLGIWKRIQSARRLFLRTEEHPVVQYLKDHEIAYESFDSIYVQKDDFESVYRTIVDRLLSEAEAQAMQIQSQSETTPPSAPAPIQPQAASEIVYAVPGHPMVAERTTQLLREECATRGIELAIMGGESFLDQAFLRFGFDPVEGFQLLDAAELQPSLLNPRLHTVIGQVYDVFSASDAKLALMDAYPDDYPVVVGHALGVVGEEQIIEVPLYELDRVEGYGNLSLIWVPRSDRDDVLNRTFHRLHEIVGILRSPEGCPWDREQTHASLRQNLIEETYEVLETLDDDDPDHMREELGDLLLQIMLHSQMEEETGAFTVFDVINELNEKLIRRHPHVFGERSAQDADEALANWQAIKQEEKAKRGEEPAAASALDGVPRDLPGLLKAYKLQKKAAKVGFDWDHIEDVLAKIEEELQEVREAIGDPSPNAADMRQDELGDLLFACVNLARFLKVDPEEALSGTNRKFVSRFRYIEEQVRKSGQKMEETSLEQMESYWQEAKTAKNRE
ncbi:nucleoside triphosphate pyrophosphohydrolase [Gorillibacterium massiliense]|uniref:nucleoside triphosphate pyrophosphohydrolase n=1 Tax=Gorillibacterium massiliense TaxID=1280390 RepID=UPI0004B5AA59|nr:nucleoside triphosphate pyrophosphohydrolase [Gorillibacterium massiliense]